MQRAEMILVRVREHDAEKVAALLDEEADVRQDEIDAGQVVAGERNAEVDRDPLPAALARRARRARGSCRSRRRRRAARTRARRPAPAISPHRLRRATLGRRSSCDHVAGRDGLAVALGHHQHQLTHVVDRLEAAGEFAVGKPHADRRRQDRQRARASRCGWWRNARRGSTVRDAPASWPTAR